jgi:hypothetical protein
MTQTCDKSLWAGPTLEDLHTRYFIIPLPVLVVPLLRRAPTDEAHCKRD